MANNKEVFNKLSKINLTDKLEAKIGLKYLSWANAWDILKQNYPDAFYTIYTRTIKTTKKEITKSEDGSETIIEQVIDNEVPYFTDEKTCFVKVGVTIEGQEYIEYLPVMDNHNNSIRASLITSTAVNKAIQRAFVKACARHGLGLYVYAGEDLPNMNINYAAIEKEADGLNIEITDEKEFETVRNHVISLITELSKIKEVSPAVISYVTKIFPQTKISATTIKDSVNLKKVELFLVRVQEAING